MNKPVYKILVGTYSEQILFGSGKVLNGKGKGIHLLEFDTQTEQIRQITAFEGLRNPSYFALSPDGKYLWAANEVKDQENGSGTVSACRFSEDKTKLECIQTLLTYGGDPCHVTVDEQGETVLVCNYAGGSVSVYTVNSDGSLTHQQTVQHTGKSILPRQTAPHVHSTRFLPQSNIVFAADLGTDKLVRYVLRNGCLEAVGDDLMLPPGSGPRQFAFADPQRCYIVSELSGELCFAQMHNDELSLCEVYPAFACGEAVCSELQISPNGRFLYLAEKGTGRIIVFEINHESGRLTRVGDVPCGGDNPRHFIITPCGRYLLCANQNSDLITVFELNNHTGLPQMLFAFDTPTPVFLKILD